MTAFAVNRADHDATLAAVVRRQLQLSWAKAKAIIAARRVRLAGQTCADPARRVKSGQRIEIAEAVQSASTSAPKRRPPRTSAAPQAIVVCYFDEHILIVDKPPGLTTMRHAEEAAEFGSRGKMYLPKTMADLLPPLVGDGLPILPVHRIDKDTSGLVVFARNADAEKFVGDQFRAHAVERRYLAIVRGCPKQERVESWLVADRGDGRRGSGPVGQGQRAVTHIRIVQRFGDISLVECRLETGRTHQVRIHLGEIGCPLAGERIYDRPIHGRPIPDSTGAKRFALHAAVIALKHPVSGRPMRWESPMPDDMRCLLSSR